MKATVERSELAAVAKWAAKVASRPAMPILAGMALEAAEAEVTLSAFDYEVSAKGSIPGSVGEPGRVLVPAAAFASFLSATRGEEVDLEVDDSTLAIRSGSARARINLLQLDEYPKLPDFTKAIERGALSHALLVDAVSRLAPLNSKDGNQQWAAAVHLAASDGRLLITAASLFAAGRIEVAFDRGDFEALVPTAPLLGVLGEMSGQVTLAEHLGCLVLLSEGRTASLRLFDAALPAIGNVLQRRGPAQLHIERESLLASVKLAATSSDRVLLDVAPSEVTVTSHEPEKRELISEVSDSTPCVASHSAQLLMATRFLVPILSGLREDTVEITFTPDATRQVNLHDATAQFALQPIHLKRS